MAGNGNQAGFHGRCGSKPAGTATEAKAGVPGRENSWGRRNAGADRGGASGLMVPGSVPTVATPDPAAALRATTGPINLIKPNTVVVLPAGCRGEYMLSITKLSL